LVGENSSGKSTFLRSFPLFRQSEEVKKIGPILWYGKYVDFGSFNESVNSFSIEKAIDFEFNFGKVQTKHRFISPYMGFANDEIDLFVKFRIIGDDKYESSTNYCEIHVSENIIILEFSPKGDVVRFDVNETSFIGLADKIKAYPGRGIFPPLFIEKNLKNIEPKNGLRRLDYDWLFENGSIEIGDSRINKDTFEEILRSSTIGTSDEMLEKIKNISFPKRQINRFEISDWSSESDEFRKLRDLIIASSIFYLFMLCNEIFADFTEKIHYIAPLRATAERYYRYQNLAIDEVDFQGQNLAMFLQNLSRSEREDFSKWTARLFGFSPQILTTQGHVSIAIQQGESVKVNVADTGFGISQVLPILTQLWKLVQENPYKGYYPFFDKSTYLAIEQPELHLHPRMQGKLAEAFTDVVNQSKKAKSDIKLVIETHSDAMINTFGHLVAKGILNPEDISIVLFEKRDNDSNSQVFTSTFDGKGYLQNWPYGFFEPDWE